MYSLSLINKQVPAAASNHSSDKLASVYVVCCLLSHRAYNLWCAKPQARVHRCHEATTPTGLAGTLTGRTSGSPPPPYYRWVLNTFHSHLNLI